VASAGMAADSVEAFYKGKTVDVYIGSAPGGGYDLYGRLIAKYMGEHIPGKPTLVPKNLPGGGGYRMMLGTYTGAPRDGTVMVIPPQGLVVSQALGEDGMNFDARTLNFIGRLAPFVGLIYTWHTSPTKTLDDARKRETVVGSTGPYTSTATFLALNVLAGTKFKVVKGYSSGTEVDLAMERGEVEGGTSAWAGIKVGNPDWLKENKLNMLAQLTTEPASDLPGVPMVIDLPQNETDRKALRLLAVGGTTGRAVATLPNVPPERVEALRAAFLKMTKAPGFMDEAEKRKIDIGIMSGVDLQKVIEDSLDVSPEVITRTKKAREG
jgi:tripartite-type tricarboxylate transporter receptor subunit TctC